MKKIKKHIYKVIMHFSLREREKREFSNYQEEYTRLEKLSEDELNARYINIKSKYGYKKNLFSFFIITVLITALTSAWSFFPVFQKICYKLWFLTRRILQKLQKSFCSFLVLFSQQSSLLLS